MAILDVTTFGASPNIPDSTAVIQQALDAAQSTDTVLVPVGTFMVDPVVSLQPKHGLNFQIDGILQAIPNDKDTYRIILLQGVAHVSIILNGQIIGERDKHLGPESQGGWGHGISMLGAVGTSITGPGTVMNCWGDGIYADQATKNLTMTGIKSIGNRRQGMSLIDIDGFLITNNEFSDNGGTPPGAGIDMEPDSPGVQSIRNGRLSGNKFNGNAGAGVLIACPSSARSNIIVDNTNTFNGRPIDGTDGIVPFYAKWLYYTCGKLPFYDYWYYPRSIQL